jgi:hypothetical protein
MLAVAGVNAFAPRTDIEQTLCRFFLLFCQSFCLPAGG